MTVLDRLDYRAPFSEAQTGQLTSDSELATLVKKWRSLLKLLDQMSHREEVAGPIAFNSWERLQLLCNQVMWDNDLQEWVVIDW